MQDKFLDCARCGIAFLWTVVEQGEDPTPPLYCPGDRSLDRLTAIRHGRVKWYDRTKGFGFITSDENADLFVHRSGLVGRKSLRSGQEVTFEVQQGPRGPQAVRVQGIQPTPEDGEASEGVVSDGGTEAAATT